MKQPRTREDFRAIAVKRLARIKYFRTCSGCPKGIIKREQIDLWFNRRGLRVDVKSAKFEELYDKHIRPLISGE